jgi:DNA-directed RNA polymerase specialized sigma24 family protein/uncharacterized protein YerC
MIASTITHPEEQLWGEVLRRAVLDAIFGRTDENYSEQKKHRQSDRAFMVDNSPDFREVCENAGLDPDKVRRDWLSGEIERKVRAESRYRRVPKSPGQKRMTTKFIPNPEMAENARALAENGLTLKQIAHEIKWPIVRTDELMTKYGIKTVFRQSLEAYLHWTPEEDEALRKMYRGRVKRSEIAKALGKNERAVGRRAVRIGATKRHYWTPEEDDQLLQMIEAGEPYKTIAEALGRSVLACHARVTALGLRPLVGRSEKRIPWTAEDDIKVLKMIGEGATYREIAKALGRGQDACRARGSFLQRGGKS